MAARATMAHQQQKEEEIRSCFVNPYKVGSEPFLGFGTYSLVVPVVSPKRFSTMNRKQLVAKVVRLESEDKDADEEEAEQEGNRASRRTPVPYAAVQEEVRILRKLQFSDKIVKMLDAYQLHEEVWIVTEYLPTDLYGLNVSQDVLMDISMIAMITSDLVDALAFMHSKRVIHMDIKPSNVLLSKSGKVKLCDFGFATEVDESGSVCTEVPKGSRYYVAPEVLFGTHSTRIDFLADVWSLGVVVHELFAGANPVSSLL